MKSLKIPKWQDAVFSTGEIVFLVGLLPSIFSDSKPAGATSLVTALMLYSFMAVHASFKLWVAFCLTFVTASLWLTLFIQVV